MTGRGPRARRDEPQEDFGLDDGSDADSDLEELENDIARYDESVRQFLDSHRGAAEGTVSQSVPSVSRAGLASRGKGSRGTRGPRKAAKPRGDITARLAKVNKAFLAGDYATALDLASEIVRINAETHQAWTTLSSIFSEIGEINKALSAMVYAAHLRPKDVAAWLRCASYALDNIDDDDEGNLHTARLCYSAALRAEPTNIEARLGKATVCHRQGHLGAAIADYNIVLKHRPHDLDLVRKLAEACIDNRHTQTAVPSAIAAYRAYFDLEINAMGLQSSEAPWHDIGIYVELFASVGRYQEAIRELKILARWIVGRSTETYWDNWRSDDREWDDSNERRAEVPEFMTRGASQVLYGPSLPIDLRARLAIYRLGVPDDEEALRHLSWLDPTEHHTRDFVAEFPFLAYDVACELYRHNHPGMAAKYLEVLREISGQPDAAVLLELGRCYLASGENAAAEECFLHAIEVDEDGIEPRIELANMYEKAKEDEEALILAAEAMALRDARDGRPHTRVNRSYTRRPRRITSRRKEGDSTGGAKKPTIPRRYRPKRLANPDKRRQEEQAHAVRMAHQYQLVREMKQQVRDGRDDLVESWMQSSRELVDDFRSLRKFYSWDKYLHFLKVGNKGMIQPPALMQPDSELSQMYERLQRTLAPQPELFSREHPASVGNSHQGISFDEWLDLFLDYAVGLAMKHRREEAYQVCEAARDSTAFQSPEHNFSIHVAWGVCAIYTCDEERCIATARHLMKEGAISDSYRMFALLSSLCQSPISWYTSGPAQKYILRQIKALDVDQVKALALNTDDAEVLNTVNSSDVDLDVCLLMLYGHILFTSTSYTYALGYFLRARALDPQNPMVNLSLGLAYVHYGLKRQSANRQYLVLQGQAFMMNYMEAAQKTGDGPSSAEMHYNIGRLYHLLGIPHVALRYYSQATSLNDRNGAMKDIALMSMTNQIISLLSVDNKHEALTLLKENIIL